MAQADLGQRYPEVRNPVSLMLLSDPGCEEWAWGWGGEFRFVLFCFLTNGNKIQKKLPLSPLSVTSFLCFSFFVTVFLFGPGDSPEDSPGSDLGGGGPTPFYLY